MMGVTSTVIGKTYRRRLMTKEYDITFYDKDGEWQDANQGWDNVGAAREAACSILNANPLYDHAVITQVKKRDLERIAKSFTTLAVPK